MTSKQERFVQEYLVDLNATQAAIRAGYEPRSAYSIGQENLKKPEIQAAIEERQAAIQQKLQVDQENVVQELIRVGFSNIADYLSWDRQGKVTPKNFRNLPRESKAAVKSYKRHVTYDRQGNRHETIEFVLHDKLVALKQLNGFLGFPKGESSQGPSPKKGEEKGVDLSLWPTDLLEDIVDLVKQKQAQYTKAAESAH
ncbi:MAG: terminase small subunit [Nitrospira sp.]|nr:terminase small subunit [Nitrospira sp.]